MEVNGGAFGALLTDLLKAFDSPSRELFLAKLDACGFDKRSLKLIHSYLSNRKQRAKINDRYSSWSEILTISTTDNNYIDWRDEQVLLGITIDSNLSFENQISNICKSQKLNALATTTPGMNIQKRTAIVKPAVTSQFNYCPLIWMFHSRRLNDKINSIHEIALRITYQDNTSTFQQLTHKELSFNTSQKLASFGNRNV